MQTETTETGSRSAAVRGAHLIQAWPWDWENRPAKDSCGHVWEIVVLDRLFDPNELVARCGRCHTPRCGYADDPEPCTLRRHHEGAHNHAATETSPSHRTASTAPRRSTHGRRP